MPDPWTIVGALGSWFGGILVSLLERFHFRSLPVVGHPSPQPSPSPTRSEVLLQEILQVLEQIEEETRTNGQRLDRTNNELTTMRGELAAIKEQV